MLRLIQDGAAPGGARCYWRPAGARGAALLFVLLSPWLLVDLAFKLYALHHVLFHKTQITYEVLEVECETEMGVVW